VLVLSQSELKKEGNHHEYTDDQKYLEEILDMGSAGCGVFSRIFGCYLYKQLG
jgi:hypothetical protein